MFRKKTTTQPMPAEASASTGYPRPLGLLAIPHIAQPETFGEDTPGGTLDSPVFSDYFTRAEEDLRLLIDIMTTIGLHQSGIAIAPDWAAGPEEGFSLGRPVADGETADRLTVARHLIHEEATRAGTVMELPNALLIWQYAAIWLFGPPVPSEIYTWY